MSTHLEIPGSSTTSGVVPTNHNDLQNIQGGNSTQRYHLSTDQYNKVISGVIESVIAGNEIVINITDPMNPIINLSDNGIDAISKKHTHYKDTVVNAELGTYTVSDLVFVYETKSLYEYNASASTFVRDGKLILNTSIGGTTRLLAIAGKYILGQAGVANGGIVIGTTDAFGRNQIWNAQTNAVLRLGSLAQDGDVLNTSSEGIIAYGTNSNGTFSQNDWAFARIKSTRFGINNCIANTQFYLFRADELGMYLKDDSNIKTFEITRSTGRTYIKGELGINTSSPRAKFDMNGVNGEILFDCVKSLTEDSLVNIIELALLNNTGGGVSIEYTIEAIDAGSNTVEMHYGKYNVITRNQNGTITYNDSHINELDLPIDSGILGIFNITVGTGKITIGLTATSGFTPTSFKLFFIVKCFGINSITLL